MRRPGSSQVVSVVSLLPLRPRRSTCPAYLTSDLAAAAGVEISVAWGLLPLWAVVDDEKRPKTLPQVGAKQPLTFVVVAYIADAEVVETFAVREDAAARKLFVPETGGVDAEQH